MKPVHHRRWTPVVSLPATGADHTLRLEIVRRGNSTNVMRISSQLSLLPFYCLDRQHRPLGMTFADSRHNEPIVTVHPIRRHPGLCVT